MRRDLDNSTWHHAVLRVVHGNPAPSMGESRRRHKKQNRRTKGSGGAYNSGVVEPILSHNSPNYENLMWAHFKDWRGGWRQPSTRARPMRGFFHLKYLLRQLDKRILTTQPSHSLLEERQRTHGAICKKYN